jgi:hypothetical protein
MVTAELMCPTCMQCSVKVLWCRAVIRFAVFRDDVPQKLGLQAHGRTKGHDI